MTQAPSASRGPRSPVATASASAALPARPLYYGRAINDADLKARTLRELSLLRNTIYARVGNSFRNPWLDKYFRAKPWYQPKEKMDESKLSQLDRDNAEKITKADAALDRAELERRRDEVLARRKAGKGTPEDVIEIGLLSERLGVWLGTDDPGLKPTPLQDPTQLDRLISVDALSTLSRRDLRMLRNLVYARRGRAFQAPMVRDYFKTAVWYKPDPGYHDGKLSGIDHKNVQIIHSVEDELGGPLDAKGVPDAWFIQA